MYHDRVQRSAQLQGAWTHTNERAVPPWSQGPRAVVDPLEASDTIRKRCSHSVLSSTAMHFSSADLGGVQLSERADLSSGPK
jgi:hypothetical protein